MSGRRRLFAAFTGDEILRESGRLPFMLIRPFVAAGYEVCIYDNLRDRLTAFYRCDEAALPETARLSLSIGGAAFTRELPEDCADTIYLFDRPLASALQRSWRKRVHVRFDLFAPYHWRPPVVAPYSMHPSQTLRATPENLAMLRAWPRALRVLFAGDSKAYVRDRVRYPGPKLPRLEVLNTLRQRLPEETLAVNGEVDIARLCESGFTRKFVLSDSGSGIAPSAWLPTLAQADFFLCPPGMVMPMCHNVVEAMSVGTIPLISYPEWLTPQLRHLHNCIAFDSRDDLVGKMRLALSMPAADVARMRANVIDHYESHLRPEVVVQALESRLEPEVTLLLHTELNMAQNSARLNGRSVLIKGPDADSPLRRVGRTLDRYVGRSSGS